MNIVTLRGGLTRDPDVKEFGATMMVSLSLAVNGTRFDKEAGGQVVKTIFVTCQGWANTADELIGYNLGKGDELFLTGELDQYRKDDDDKPHTRVTIFDFSVIRKRSTMPTQPPPPPQQPPAADPWAAPTQEPPHDPAW